MAKPSIVAVYNKAFVDIRIIENYLQKSRSLPPNMQGFVAEVLMLRLFSILETAVRETALRVACGASYRNNYPSNPIIICSSINNAIIQFKTCNRRRSLLHLKFTNVSQTNESVRYIISRTEPFYVNLNRYSLEFDEMRKVRNHIAHRYKNTYVEYKQLIISRYGAFINLKPGVFLISTKRQTRSIIDEYIIKTKVIISDITSG